MSGQTADMLPRAYLTAAMLALFCADAARVSADPKERTFPEDTPVTRLVEIMREAHEKKDGEAVYAAFMAACRKATAGELGPLAEHLRSYNPDWVMPEEMYLGLADASIRSRLPKTLSHRPEFPEVALPESLAKYPEGLREAASYYLRVHGPYAALNKSVVERRNIRANLPRYNALALGAIGASDASPEKILAFKEFLCGCGRDRSVLAKTQPAAALLMLMRDQRWAEAVGAALSLRESSKSAGSVLSLAGVDEDKLMVGEIVAEAAPAPASRRRLINLLGGYLKTRGDERVDVLIDLAKASPSGQLHLYIQSLAYFLAKNPEPQRKPGLRMFWGAWGSSTDETVYVKEVPPVSTEASQRALGYLCDVASPSLSNKEALALVRAFERRYLEESYPALRTLLSHPAGRVVDGAESALREAEQEVQAPDVPSQLQYRLLVNGQPLRNTRIEVVVDRSWSAAGDPTDENGTISVDQSPFVDPQPAVRETILKSRRELEPGSPIFAHRLSLPKDVTKVTDVEIVSHRIKLKLAIPRLDVEFAEKKMEIVLIGPRIDAEFSFDSLTYIFEVPASREFEFPPLAAGEYELKILVPGCARWTGNFRVEVDREMKIDLQKGSDVRYAFTSSDSGVQFVIPQLFKNGKEVKLDRPSFGLLTGLPSGRYVLRVPSSAELRRETGRHLDEGTRFGAAEIPFVLNEDSPAQVDLGGISLPAPVGDE